MEAVKKARNRMSQLPLLTSQCKTQAEAYAKCAISIDDIKKNYCQKEFSQFLDCVRRKAASKNIKFI